MSILQKHYNIKKVCRILSYITNPILKISMFTKKYSMFYSSNIRYTVNINKEHEKSVEGKGENGI
ncbi:hypothetical protein K030075H31_46160 [Blautia producta]